MGCNGGRVVREPPLRGIAVVGEGVMGSRRRGNGGWGRSPTRDAPTGDVFMVCNGGRAFRELSLRGMVGVGGEILRGDRNDRWGDPTRDAPTGDVFMGCNWGRAVREPPLRGIAVVGEGGDGFPAVAGTTGEGGNGTLGVAGGQGGCREGEGRFVNGLCGLAKGRDCRGALAYGAGFS